MIEQYFSDAGRLTSLRSGALGSVIDQFGVWLDDQDYPRATARSKLGLVGFLSQWMRREGIAVGELDDGAAARCAAVRRGMGLVDRNDLHTYQQLLKVTREAGVGPSPDAEASPSPIDSLLQDYAGFLRRERRVAESTVSNYLPLVRRFLGDRPRDALLQVHALKLGDLTSFIIGLTRSAPGRAGLARSALRSFFRFLQVRGLVEHNVSEGLPRVTRWRLSPLPDRLNRDEVARLLKFHDRSKNVGMRNYAILLVLVRLGLRASEVCALTLDDVDWRGGTVIVHGKGGRQDRLPLPRDVGKALATYLREARPVSESRRVFLTHRAPRRPLVRAGVGTVVARALRRTGLRQRGSAHLLRHSMAAEMLNRGASLAEVGEVLRHETTSTTEIYAKVRVEALRKLALPWPTVGDEA